MPHFSRLTDIITCSLTEILETAADPRRTLAEIIDEMNEGLSACRRNVRASSTNSDRLQREIADYESQVKEWKDRARQSLAHDDEDAARDALRRKVEVENLVAGLRPELEAAATARQNMLRIQKALDARHAEAVRRMEELTGEPLSHRLESETAEVSASAASQQRASEVEAELEALKRELSH
jgi:phage shock protein A